MRFAAAIAGLMMLAGCAVAQPAAPSGYKAGDWRAAIGKLHNQAVGGVCSGFLVRADLVATAAHCITRARARDMLFTPAGTRTAWRGVEVVAAGGFLGGEVIKLSSAGRDWALIRIAPTKIAPLPLAALHPVQIRRAVSQGAQLKSFGFADGNALVEHARCALRDEWGDAFLTTDCQIHPGDSGGPVLLVDEYGARVVGLNVGINDEATLVVSARRFAPWAGDDNPFDTRSLAQATPERELDDGN